MKIHTFFVQFFLSLFFESWNQIGAVQVLLGFPGVVFITISLPLQIVLHLIHTNDTVRKYRRTNEYKAFIAMSIKRPKRRYLTSLTTNYTSELMCWSTITAPKNVMRLFQTWTAHKIHCKIITNKLHIPFRFASVCRALSRLKILPQLLAASTCLLSAFEAYKIKIKRLSQRDC